MEAYYQQQAVPPNFCRVIAVKEGFGVLAASSGRAVLHIARNVLWTVAKKLGKDLVVQAAPEIVEVVRKRKTPKKRLKLLLKNRKELS